MDLSRRIKNLIKRPLNRFGWDVVRFETDTAGLNPIAWSVSDVADLKWMSIYNINTILDIGANIGHFACFFHDVLPQANIYSFEPLKDAYAELQRNIKSSINIQAFNYGLGNKNETLSMHKSSYSPSSSLLEMGELHKAAFPHTANHSTEPIEIRRLDEVVDEFTVKDNLLIKIDVQGYEDQVIYGAENVIPRAKIIIIETTFMPLYVGQPLFDDIYTLLHDRGFDYMGSMDQVRDPCDGCILQADAIFIKP
jgi:FkbM family methyltransferase